MIPSVRIDKGALGAQLETFKRVPRAAARVVAYVCVVLAEALKAEAPVAKPQLIHPLSKRAKRHYSASIKGTARVLRGVNLADGLSAHGAVGTTAQHSRFVNEGTRAHIIEARRAKCLTIPGVGATVRKAKGKGGRITGWSYPKRVNHPGTKANKFVDRAKLRLTNEVYRSAFLNACRVEHVQ